MKVVHIKPLESIDIPTARQLFNMAGAHILPFNDHRVREGCISAIIMDDVQYHYLRTSVGCINEQAAHSTGWKNVITLEN